MIYETIYKKIEKLIDFEELINNGYLKYQSKDFMDLNIDLLDNDKKNKKMRIALAHNYVQNGDLMADPDMEIEIYFEMKMAEALTYQQDNLGIYQAVYDYDEKGNKISVRPRYKKELNSFLLQWLRNVESQGFELTNNRPDDD